MDAFTLLAVEWIRLVWFSRDCLPGALFCGNQRPVVRTISHGLWFTIAAVFAIAIIGSSDQNRAPTRGHGGTR